MMTYIDTKLSKLMYLLGNKMKVMGNQECELLIGEGEGCGRQAGSELYILIIKIVAFIYYTQKQTTP